MSSDIPNPNPQPDASAEQESASLFELNPETTGALSNMTSDSNWSDMAGNFLQSVGNSPNAVGNIVSEYRQPITVVVVFILAVVSAAIANGILDVINALPLVAPFLELIGLGYTGWFIWRYLIYAEKRQELATDYEALRKRVVGHIEQSVDP